LQTLANGDSTVAADAAVLVSAAQRGLGLHEAGKAADLQRLALSRLPGIRAELEAWKMHNAAAEAAASYDPAPEFARIDDGVRDRQEQAELARASKAVIDREIAGLLESVASRMAEASDLRGQAGALQLQIPGVSATEGLALTEQIRVLTRKADGLEFEAREIKTQADRKTADLHATEVEIAKLESQIELFAKSRTAVQTRQTAAQQRAARARGDAQKAANMIAMLVDTADSAVPPALAEVMAVNESSLELSAEELFGSGPAAITPFLAAVVTPTIESAARQFTTAASTAKRASSARRGASQIAVGEAKQSLGDIRWMQAGGLDAYAQMMEELASAHPALPSAAEYASRAQTARVESVEAKQAAFEAFQDAKSAYEGSGAKGDVKDRLEEVGARLNDISKIVGEGVMDAEALDALEEPEPILEEEADFDEPMAEEPAEGGNDPEAELRATIQQVLDAAEAGDYDAVVGFLHPASDADVGFIEATGTMLRAVGRLDGATRTTFGESFTSWMENNPDPMLGQMGNMGSGALGFDLDSLDLRVQGDEAVALSPMPNMPDTKFAKIDGRWKQVIDTQALLADNPMAGAALEMMQALIPAISSAYAELVESVEAGDLDSNAAVAEAFKAKLMAIMQQQIPGG
ncbi:hypothetical protein MNBD_PLANCTO03-313, partial [hydrothermal vent metagenome]